MKLRQHAKKSLATLLIAAGSSLLCLEAQADNGSSDPNQSLEATITSLATAAANTVSDAVYQFDQNLPGIVQANTANSNITNGVATSTTTQTLANIKSSLQAFPQAVIPPKNTPPNVLQNMTYGTPSSDTLYSPHDPALAVFNMNPQAIPNNDDYFDVDSLIGPVAYNADQLTAAQNYTNYLNEVYLPLGATIDFSPLASMTYPSFLNFVQNNTVYQNYQAQVRSYMAMNSIALSNFNDLMTERTVQPGLGTSVGMTTITPTGPVPVADASPLQVQQYIATHRNNNVQWYQSMASASPTTVQRETLFVLAEMEGQLQQLHMDNERLLTTLTALVVNNANAQKAQLQVQESQVNSAIKATANSDQSSSAASNSSTQAAQAQAQASAQNLPASDTTATLPSSQ